jgi:hypothetical protein
MQSAQYPPYDDKNPWKLDTFMNADEWKEVSRWYDHSLRSLMPDGRWYEQARCKSRESAYHILRALASSDPDKRFVIIHCTLTGKDGREKAVYCFPGSEQTILAERQARLKRKL